MKTNFYCVFELYDTTAAEDSTVTTDYNQSFGNAGYLPDDTKSTDYATLEEDFFLLDGSLAEMPDEPEDVVFMSSVMSDADGNFPTNPTIEISFTENHSSIGLTFYFLDDPPTGMTVYWYDSNNTPLEKATFETDSNEYYASQQVEDYRKIIIEFTSALPYRYVKLRHLEYGKTITFGSNGYGIEDASLTEECDMSCDKIAVNELSFKVIDTEDDFNIGNNNGLHKVLQQRQEALAYETVDGEDYLLGKFFLSSHSESDYVASLEFKDYKGFLDDRDFRGGRVYNGDLAGDVIAEIMSAAGITDYTVTDDVANTPIYGWLKIQTCRKALREILFACGAVAETARSKTLDIYKPEKLVKYTIERSRKFSTTVANEEYYTDVSVSYPIYTLADSISQIVGGSYTAGTYTIELSSPATDMTIDNGTITEQTNNYVTFTLDTDADIVITGTKYNKEDVSVTASLSELSAGRVRASKNYTCAVANASLAQAAAARLLDYYGLQLKLKCRFLNDSESPSRWAKVQNVRQRYSDYYASIEKLTTDLTGGFISTAEMRGYYEIDAGYYYTGEIYAGESVGVL